MEGGLPDPSVVALARQREAEGDFPGAMALFAQSFQYGDAARLAWQLGRLGEAAELCIRGGLNFEAATCLFQAGRAEDAVPQLLRVPVTHPRYRDACIMAIGHCGTTGQVDLRLEALLARWLADAPQGPRECDALYDLAMAYLRHGFTAGARDALARLVAVSPNHKDAAQHLARLMAQSTVPTPMPAAASAGSVDALAEERSFRRAGRQRTQQMPAVAGPPVDTGARTQVLGDGAVPLQAAGTDGPGLLDVGAVVAGRYRLQRRLGQGGMAVVFEARDEELNETVAIKLYTQLLTDEDLKARFKREVSLSRSLTHPNIIRVYDIGTVSGHKYMTMELLTGTDMEKYIRTRPAIDIPHAVRLMRQLCAGLDYAHERGVVHRDIKPANFFITADNVVKIMDFGIARDLRTPGHTAAGVIMGTPEYMSPEQFQEFNSVTPLADIYALGVVGFHLFTGSLPYQAGDLVKLAMLHFKEPVPSLRERNPAISPELEAIIFRMMSKEPAQRFQHAAEVSAALDATLPRAPAPVL